MLKKFYNNYKDNFIIQLILVLFFMVFIVDRGYLDLTRTDNGIIIEKKVRVSDVDDTPLSGTFIIETPRRKIQFVDNYGTYNLGDELLVEYKVPIIRFWKPPYIIRISEVN